MHQHVLGLADTESAVRRLVFYCRVPPPVEVHHMRCRRQIEAGAASLERKHKEPLGFIFLKAAHQFLALSYRGLAMQDQAGPAKDRTKESRQRRGYLAELGEDEHFFLLRGNHLGDFPQACPFTAVRLAPGSVSQPVGRVVADLLEPHQKRQHQTFALYPRCVRKLFRELPHRLLVEGGLLSAELTERFDFGFVRQIPNDRLIGLQPP